MFRPNPQQVYEIPRYICPDETCAKPRRFGVPLYICLDEIHANLRYSRFPCLSRPRMEILVSPSIHHASMGDFLPPTRWRAHGWTPFECINLGFPDPHPNGICASAGVLVVLPRMELVQVWAGNSWSPNLFGWSAKFGARWSTSGRNSCMGHSRSCDTNREQAGVQKYPLSVRMGKGAPFKCGRFGALGSIQTIYVGGLQSALV